MKAIKEHHNIFSSSSDYYNKPYGVRIKAANKFDWSTGNEYAEHNIRLKVDSGEYQLIDAFWIGYFEHLYGAKIVILNDEDETLHFRIE